MLSIFLHILLSVVLIYCGICVVYFFLQEKFIFVPTIPGEPFEAKITGESEEYFIETPNGGKIHAMLIRNKNPMGLVFYLHGNTGSLKRWQFMAEEISDYGYDVFTIDYRGYGKSKGKKSEAIMHRDVEHCYDFIVSKYSNSNIVIYGRSLGCAFATRLATRRSSSKIVLETPFLNMIKTGKYYLPFLPVKYLLRYRFRSDIYIQFIDKPILVLHGTKDIVVPHSHAIELFRTGESHQREIKMVTIVGGKHSNLNSFPLFRERLCHFLKEQN
jgi:uncharacterized protein